MYRLYHKGTFLTRFYEPNPYYLFSTGRRVFQNYEYFYKQNLNWDDCSMVNEATLEEFSEGHEVKKLYSINTTILDDIFNDMKLTGETNFLENNFQKTT